MHREALDAQFDLQRRYKDVGLVQKVEVDIDSLAFNLSIKPVDRIFEFNSKIMNFNLSGLENPIKTLMTEAYVEGFKTAQKGK